MLQANVFVVAVYHLIIILLVLIIKSYLKLMKKRKKLNLHSVISYS